MKQRTGFVSNSSSSSFVLDKTKLSAVQIDEIVRHAEIAKERYSVVPERKYAPNLSNNLGWLDPWQVKIDDNTITVHTYQDNFNMRGYLKLIEAESTIIKEDADDSNWDVDY